MPDVRALQELDKELDHLRQEIARVESAPISSPPTPAELSRDAKLIAAVAQRSFWQQHMNTQRALLGNVIGAEKRLRELAQQAATTDVREERGLVVRNLGPSLDAAIRRLVAAPTLVISGGVSLGSYQAGYVDAVLRNLRSTEALIRASRNLDQPRVEWEELGRTPDPWAERAKKGFAGEPRRIRVAAGASAGSVTAFLAGIQSCLNETPSLKDSVLFDVWVNLGLERLYKPDKVTGEALFDRNELERVGTQLVEFVTRADRKWRPDCRFGLGVTTTRFIPRELEVPQKSGTRWPRLTEKFLFELRTDGSGAPAVMWLPESGTTPFMVRLTSNGLADIARVMIASGTFPVAFGPTKLSYEVLENGQRREYKDAAFLDGGTLNNNPLDLARSVEKMLKVSSNHPYIFFDQDQTTAAEPLTDPDRNGPLLELYMPLIKNLFGAAGALQFVSALEEEDLVDGVSGGTSRSALFDQLLATRRQLPSPSEYYFAMSGFFERDFRVFDYYRGFIDAAAWTRTADPLSAVLDELGIQWSMDDASAGGAFACVRTRTPGSSECQREYVNTSVTGTEGERRTNILVLMEVANLLRERRESNCGPAEHARDEQRQSKECHESWSFDAFEELLVSTRVARGPGLPEETGYEFGQLAWQGEKARPDTMRRILRGIAGDALVRLSAQQKKGTIPLLGHEEGIILHTVGDYALNLFSYHPRPFVWGLNVNSTGVEAHVTGQRLLSRATRTDLSLRLMGRYSWANLAVDNVGVTQNRQDAGAAVSLLVGQMLPAVAFIPDGLVRIDLGAGVSYRHGWLSTGGETDFLTPELWAGTTLLDRIEVNARFGLPYYWVGNPTLDTPAPSWPNWRPSLYAGLRW